jgi:SnoaL-like domain
MSADAWVGRVRPLFTGLAATQHSMTNPLVRAEPSSGDDAARANCRMYMQAHHVLDAGDPASWFTIGGYYDDVLVRRDDTWKLCAVRLTVLWRRGDPSVMVRARTRT